MQLPWYDEMTPKENAIMRCYVDAWVRRKHCGQHLPWLVSDYDAKVEQFTTAMVSCPNFKLMYGKLRVLRMMAPDKWTELMRRSTGKHYRLLPWSTDEGFD